MLFFCSIVYLFQNYAHNPWLVHLAYKMLNNDNVTMALIEENPFEGKDPPTYDSTLPNLQQQLLMKFPLLCFRFVQADHYRYSYTKIGSERAQEGHWWDRKVVGEYLPAVNLRSLEAIVQKQGWKRMHGSQPTHRPAQSSTP